MVQRISCASAARSCAGPSWSTGLALLNTTSTDANVEVYVMRKTGALVGSQSFVIPRGTKKAPCKLTGRAVSVLVIPRAKAGC